MRIIAGQFRSQQLYAPLTDQTRPTSDRLRETIFNIVTHQLGICGQSLSDCHVLDVFAGTGALGLEALSRGARYTTFIEKTPGAIQILKANIEKLKVKNQTKVIPICFKRLPRATQKHSLVFLDPPYGQNLVEKSLIVLHQQQWLEDQALIVCEMEASDGLIQLPHFKNMDSRIYNKSHLQILQYVWDASS